MQEIADDLGLSRITVSLVINGHAKQRKLADATVEKVEQYLRDVGYVRSREAMALRTGQRTAVGILHCGHLFSHLTQAFNLLTDHFADSESGVEVVVRNASGTLNGLKEMVSRGVERLILIYGGPFMIPVRARDEFLTLAGRLGAVIYNYGFDWTHDDEELLSRGISLVGFSRKKVYEQMARVLKSGGHRRVLLADVPSGSNILFDQQMIEAIDSHGIEIIYPSWPTPKDKDLLKQGIRIGKHIARLQSSMCFSAICFRDDCVAGGAMSSMLKHGISIPHEISVIGMDGHPLCPIFPVPLATFEVPVEEMVSQTIQIISGKCPSAAYKFQCQFQNRESFAKARKPRMQC